jgi:hypothetical protein
VLLSVLSEGGHVSERWAAVQALAVMDVASADIVGELLSHLLNPHEPVQQARAAQLLARLSSKTVSQCKGTHTQSHTMAAQAGPSAHYREAPSCHTRTQER